MAIEKVVAENQAGGVAVEKILAYMECLGEASRMGLDSIFNFHAPVTTVTEQGLEHRLVMWGGDNEYLTDASKEQYGERVIHHGFIIDREQLLADGLGDWIEAGPTASG